MNAGGGYVRPSSRSQGSQRERERERQLLQEALSLYLASTQPSYRHRGSVPIASAGKSILFSFIILCYNLNASLEKSFMLDLETACILSCLPLVSVKVIDFVQNFPHIDRTNPKILG